MFTLQPKSNIPTQHCTRPKRHAGRETTLKGRFTFSARSCRTICFLCICNASWECRRHDLASFCKEWTSIKWSHLARLARVRRETSPLKPQHTSRVPQGLAHRICFPSTSLDQSHLETLEKQNLRTTWWTPSFLSRNGG